MSERLRFIARLEDGESATELAREFGISTKTAYKFWQRWKQHGVRGLEDRSHAAVAIPNQTPEAVVELIVAMRKQYPSWGARTLKARLERVHPGIRFPSAETIHSWLKKKGLVEPPGRPRRRTPREPGRTRQRATAPNDIWATDYKGQFRLGDKRLCYPLTVTDLYSRYIIGCEALSGTAAEPAWEVFEKLFAEYGLPSEIRSDNGAPFASTGLAGLTKLSAKWLRLGIRLERIEPAHPEQNGQHERMHRTLKEATTRPAGANLMQQQERFDVFVEEFNHVRPHRALDMRCPADLYMPSLRRYQGLPELEYPLCDDIKRVHPSGEVRLTKRLTFHLSVALAGECVGVREVEDGTWLVIFAGHDLGHFHERDTSFVATTKAKSNGPSPIGLD